MIQFDVCAYFFFQMGLELNHQMGVSKKYGYPKMDGFIMENPIFLMDDLGGKPTI